MKNLEWIELGDCETMEELIAINDYENEERGQREFLLPKLKRLSLKSMHKLKSIFSCNGVMVCDSLEVVDITFCPKLKKILSSSKLQLDGLTNLEVIKVENCVEMEEIMALDDVDGEETSKKELMISLPKLRRLTIHDMPKLKRIINICGSNGVMVCDSLEVDIKVCPKLKKILSSSKLQLEVIDVRSCDEMEEIMALIDVDGEETSKEELMISLPKLRWLTIYQMPKLKGIINICGGNGVMVCDSLQGVGIRDCPQLKHLLFYLPIDEEGQPSPPPALDDIFITRKWWEALEWDHLHPDAKNSSTSLL